MKALPLLLFLLYLNDVISQTAGNKHPFYNSNSLPRKNMRILISRKFLNGKPLPVKTKKPSLKHEGYTVFPAIASLEKKVYHVPSSPYFPLEQFDSQNRVKKVLDDYVMTVVRKKRSAEPKKENRKGEKRRRDRKRSGPERSKKTKITRQSGIPRHSISTQGKKDLSIIKLHPNGTINSVKVDETSNHDKRSRRLIAARDALIEDYPYVVSIQKNGEHWCAGALLNPILVITTANCMWKSNRISRLHVRVGSRHSDRGGTLVGIQEVMKHPNWSIRKNPDNDLALLILDQRIKFSDKIHGVDLPNRIMMPPFEDAWISSWGADRRDGVIDKKSITLQVYHAHLMDLKSCNNVTQRFGITVTENFICLSQSGRRAPCTRDTGAPAVSDGVLWGLASWGIRKLCGTERFPAMFSYLASQTNMDFIANATRFLMSDERLNPFLDRFPTEPYVPTTTVQDVYPFKI